MEEEFLPVSEKKPKKAKFGIKPLSLISGIVDFLIGAVILGFGIYTAMQFSGIIDTGNRDLNALLGMFFWPIIIAILLVFGVAGVCFLFMGILTIISAFKSDRHNLNGLLKTVIVFDVLLLFPAIYLSATQEGTARIIYIALSVVLVLGFVFKLTDIILTNKRLKEYRAEKAEEYKTKNAPNFEGLAELNSQPKQKGKKEEISASVESASEDVANAENTTEDNAGENSGSGSGGVDFSNLGK